MTQAAQTYIGSELAQPSATDRQVYSFSFHGTGITFLALMLKNVLLTMVTLGLYMPWAKTERRRYLWQNVEVHGHRLRYHGTGKELAIGYLKVFGGFMVFMLVATLGGLLGPAAQIAFLVVWILALAVLVPFAIWGSRRYLLSRTSWRGVHLRLEGDPKQFARTFLVGYVLTVITLGIYGPIWMNRLYRLTMNGSCIGTQRFHYTGEDRDALRIGIKGFLLSLVTFGIYSFWYLAELSRYRVSHTWFDRAQGRLELTGLDLVQLIVLQLVGLTLTFGLAFPWIAAYSLRFTLSRLQFVGDVDFARIHQAPSDGDAAADGLADALDLGVAI